MAARLTHVVLKVSDLDRSIAFYRDGRPAGHTVWLAPSPAAAVPEFVIVLYQHALDAPLDHLGFQCDSREEIDRIASDARALGILAEPPFDGGGDIGYVTQIVDPDGHRVEFTHGQPLAGLAGRGR